jgi:hypothetical protein
LPFLTPERWCKWIRCDSRLCDLVRWYPYTL